MLAVKDSKPAASGEWETTEREEESATPTSQPSGLGELATTTAAPTGRGQGAVQHVQVGSASGADRAETSRDGTTKKSSPTPANRPKKYALELWVEIEVSPGVYGTPEDDSYGVDFVMEVLNQAYPGCTGLYLDVAGHMVAFYGKKGPLGAPAPALCSVTELHLVSSCKAFSTSNSFRVNHRGRSAFKAGYPNGL